ncbi:hypothetical protein LTS09_014427 [Friedmanniomyces endolithicus]|nr:hypothetical protein LTS09_014427 [Friedmanniomyces endolithicus]
MATFVDPRCAVTAESPHVSNDPSAAGDTVEVVVGAEKRTFHVHETLLRSRSAFFEAALSKEWKEGQARKVELLDDDVRAFEGYSRWLYTGKLAVVKSDQRTDYELLAMLCGFGEKIIDHRFQNCVLDAIVAGTRINVPKATGGVHKEFPGQNTVDRVYKATPKGSPARRLVLDMYTLKGNENWIRPGEKFNQGMAYSSSRAPSGTNNSHVTDILPSCAVKRAIAEDMAAEEVSDPD